MVCHGRHEATVALMGACPTVPGIRAQGCPGSSLSQHRTRQCRMKRGTGCDRMVHPTVFVGTTAAGRGLHEETMAMTVCATARIRSPSTDGGTSGSGEGGSSGARQAQECVAQHGHGSADTAAILADVSTSPKVPADIAGSRKTTNAIAMVSQRCMCTVTALTQAFQAWPG